MRRFLFVLACVALYALLWSWWVPKSYPDTGRVLPAQAYRRTSRCLTRHHVPVTVQRNGHRTAHFGPRNIRWPHHIVWWYEYTGSGISLTPVSYTWQYDTTRRENRIFARCHVEIT